MIQKEENEEKEPYYTTNTYTIMCYLYRKDNMKEKLPVKQAKTRTKDGRWKNGVSGNPNGRPKKNLCVSDLLKEIGETELPKSNETLLELMVHKVFEKAIAGDMRAIEFITERLEGRAYTKKFQEEWIKPIDFIDLEGI